MKNWTQSDKTSIFKNDVFIQKKDLSNDIHLSNQRVQCLKDTTTPIGLSHDYK